MKYHNLVRYYESCLEKHELGPQAVDWPDEHAANTSYRMMLSMIPPGEGGTLLDFGCGLSGLKQYMDACRKTEEPSHASVEYIGLDLSEKFIAKCRELYPHTEYLFLDVMKEDPERLGRQWDWVVCDGVFTEKTRPVLAGDVELYPRDAYKGFQTDSQRHGL
jgi:hypothetical protein